MNHRMLASSLVLLCCLFNVPVVTSAQTSDRAQVAEEIRTLRREMKVKEQQFLSVAPDDVSRFAEFLQQPDTGLFRLMPRGKYKDVLSMRESGAYYSFTRREHEYERGSDIELQQDQFGTGFAGANFGFMLKLGDVPLESVTTETPGVAYLTAFEPPTTEPEARTQQIAVRGFRIGDFAYANRMPASLNQSYILRSVDYGTSDVLVAFRVVRREADESVVLLWKMLKRFPTPQLEKTTTASSAQ